MLRLSCCLLLATSLLACGGDDGASSNVPSPPVGDPTQGPGMQPDGVKPPIVPDAPVVPGMPGALPGAIWNDFGDGVRLMSPSGKVPRRITAQLDELAPTHDGKRYAFVTHHGIHTHSTLAVADTATLETRHQWMITGYAYRIRPSPVDVPVVVVTQRPSGMADEPVEHVFYDLARQQVLKRMPWRGSVEWLPDGRYIRVEQQTGAIYVGDARASETLSGKIALPVGKLASTFSVSHAGTRIALRVRAASGGDSDIWLANVDGSGFERLTQTTMTTHAVWSPGDTHLAFDVDKGASCQFSCEFALCDMFYMPATARAVSANGEPGQGTELEVRDDKDGKSLGCSALAWTDAP